MNAQTSIVAGDGVNWRDMPVITDQRLHQIERAACAAEWKARRWEYRSFIEWHRDACYALEDIDLRFEEGQRQQRNAWWADYEKRKCA